MCCKTDWISPWITYGSFANKSALSAVPNMNYDSHHLCKIALWMIRASPKLIYSPTGFAIYTFGAKPLSLHSIATHLGKYHFNVLLASTREKHAKFWIHNYTAQFHVLPPNLRSCRRRRLHACCPTCCPHLPSLVTSNKWPLLCVFSFFLPFFLLLLTSTLCTRRLSVPVQELHCSPTSVVTSSNGRCCVINSCIRVQCAWWGNKPLRRAIYRVQKTSNKVFRSSLQ